MALRLPARGNLEAFRASTNADQHTSRPKHYSRRHATWHCGGNGSARPARLKILSTSGFIAAFHGRVKTNAAYRRRTSSTDSTGKQHGANGTRGLTRGTHRGARCEAVVRGGGDSGLTEPAHDNMRDVQLSPSAAASWLRTAFIDQFLPICLITGVTFGYLYPPPGQLAQSHGLATYTTFIIFLLSGLTLRLDDILNAVKAWPALLYGLIAILGLTPLAALVTLRLPLQPAELAVGLAVFCCVPTTLSSGVSLTQAVGGNTALALALTVMSNLIGIFTMPLVLSSLVGGAVGVSLPPGPLLRALLKSLLLPLLIGAVPWAQVSSAHTSLCQIAPAQLAAAVTAGIAIHLSFLLFHSLAVSMLPGGSRDVGIKRAVVLMASQKALPVAVAVASKLGHALGDPALLLLPCIATHVNQILIDSVLVSYWLRRDEKGK